jgi:hypothetical protein
MSVVLAVLLSQLVLYVITPLIIVVLTASTSKLAFKIDPAAIIDTVEVALNPNVPSNTISPSIANDDVAFTGTEVS